jgi:SAM-dependent methyltransferase
VVSIDFGRTAEDYARHRAGFPAELFERLAASFGVGLPGQRVVDLGTGTGSLARGFARRGCEVIGIDAAERLLEQARALDRDAGVTVRYLTARAEETGLDDGSADVVTAGQAWHWFERARAARDARRVLVDGGHLAICHLDWVALPGNVAQLSEELILAANPAWASSPPGSGPGQLGIYPQWTVDVLQSGFGGLETFSFDITIPYSHAAWRGRLRACSGVGASLTGAEVERFDAELNELLRTRFPIEPMDVPHRVWALVATAV